MRSFFSDTFCISSVLSVVKLMNVAFLEFYANDASKIRTDEYKVKAINLLTQPASPEMNSSECDFKGKAQIDSKV